MRVFIDRITGAYGNLDDLRVVTLSDTEDHEAFFDFLDNMTESDRADVADVHGADVAATYEMPLVDVSTLEQQVFGDPACSCGMADYGTPGHDGGPEYVGA